jgi:hypothetical protein
MRLNQRFLRLLAAESEKKIKSGKQERRKECKAMAVQEALRDPEQERVEKRDELSIHPSCSSWLKDSFLFS